VVVMLDDCTSGVESSTADNVLHVAWYTSMIATVSFASVVRRSLAKRMGGGQQVAGSGVSPSVSLQARLDALDEGKRTVDTEWHDWGDASIGGASKPSDLL
jgi:hypothetical protein